MKNGKKTGVHKETEKDEEEENDMKEADEEDKGE